MFENCLFVFLYNGDEKKMKKEKISNTLRIYIVTIRNSVDGEHFCFVYFVECKNKNKRKTLMR